MERIRSTLSRYLAGVAFYGVVYGIVTGLTLPLSGVPPVLPIAALSFVAGFIALIGAIIARCIAALVAHSSRVWSLR